MKLIDFDKLEKFTEDNDIDEVEEGWDGDFFKKYSRRREGHEETDDDLYISMPDGMEKISAVKDDREDAMDEYVRVPVDLEEQEERRRKALIEEQEDKKHLVIEKEEEDIYALDDELESPITLEERREQLGRALGLFTDEDSLQGSDEELPDIDFESVAEQYVSQLQSEEQYMEGAGDTEERAQNIEQVFGKWQEESEADIEWQESDVDMQRDEGTFEERSQPEEALIEYDPLLYQEEPEEDSDYEKFKEEYINDYIHEKEHSLTEEQMQQMDLLFGEEQEEPEPDMEWQTWESDETEEESVFEDGSPSEAEEFLEEEDPVEYNPLLYQDEPEKESDYKEFREKYIRERILEQEPEEQEQEETEEDLELLAELLTQEWEPEDDDIEGQEREFREGSEEEHVPEEESLSEEGEMLEEESDEESEEESAFVDEELLYRIEVQEKRRLSGEEYEDEEEEHEASEDAQASAEMNEAGESEEADMDSFYNEVEEEGSKYEDDIVIRRHEAKKAKKEKEKELQILDIDVLYSSEKEDAESQASDIDVSYSEEEESAEPQASDIDSSYIGEGEETELQLSNIDFSDIEEDDDAEPRDSDIESDVVSVNDEVIEVESEGKDNTIIRREVERKITKSQINQPNVEISKQQKVTEDAKEPEEGSAGAVAVHARQDIEQPVNPASERVRKHLVKELESQEEENTELAGVLQKRKLPERLQQSMPQKPVATESGIQEMLEVAEHAEAVRKPYRKKRIEKLQSSFEEEFQGNARDDLFVRKTREQRREIELRNKEREKKRKKSHWEEDDTPDRPLREFFGLIIGILIVVAATFLLVEFVGQRTEVSGTSMETTLHDGDNLIVDKISYMIGEPERYDIIVFPFKGANSDEEIYYIKRIIGLPGEKVQIINGFIYINGEQLEESYGKDNELILNPGRAEQVIQLADDEYFVLGDNRNNSSDSREIGNIKRDEIVGKAWLRIWPFKDFGILKHQ